MSTYMVMRKEERRMCETFPEGALAGAGRLMLHEVTIEGKTGARTCWRPTVGETVSAHKEFTIW